MKSKDYHKDLKASGEAKLRMTRQRKESEAPYHHVIHKLPPPGDSPYVRAKHAQVHIHDDDLERYTQISFTF